MKSKGEGNDISTKSLHATVNMSSKVNKLISQ